jgi:hypothetical protein
LLKLLLGRREIVAASKQHEHLGSIRSRRPGLGSLSPREDHQIMMASTTAATPARTIAPIA